MRSPADVTRWATAAACLWLALATPLARGWLEASMASHMLVQLPLLAAIGWCIGRAWLRSTHDMAAGTLAGAQTFNAGGATGLVAASFVMVLWMLPRCLDLARLDAPIDALKFLTVPGAGLAVALSWPRLPV